MRKDKKDMYSHSNRKGKKVGELKWTKAKSIPKKKPEYSPTRFYGTAAWKKTRERKLKDTPTCERCRSKGRLRPAYIVHHRHPLDKGGEQLEQDNLMSICSENCHRAEHREIEEKLLRGEDAW